MGSVARVPWLVCRLPQKVMLNGFLVPGEVSGERIYTLPPAGPSRRFQYNQTMLNPTNIAISR